MRSGVALSVEAIAGKAGRYMSIEKGPTADSKPRIRINLVLLIVCMPR
jgi:hypothetical protein